MVLRDLLERKVSREFQEDQEALEHQVRKVNLGWQCQKEVNVDPQDVMEIQVHQEVQVIQAYQDSLGSLAYLDPKEILVFLVLVCQDPLVLKDFLVLLVPLVDLGFPDDQVWTDCLVSLEYLDPKEILVLVNLDLKALQEHQAVKVLSVLKVILVSLEALVHQVVKVLTVLLDQKVILVFLVVLVLVAPQGPLPLAFRAPLVLLELLALWGLLESLVRMERKETVAYQVRVFQGCKVTEEALDFLGLLVLLVHLGVQDYLVKMVYQDCPGLRETLVGWVLQDLQVPLATLADKAFQDQKEMTVSQDDQEAQVFQDQRETKETQAFQAHLAKAHLVVYLRDKKENPDLQVLADNQEQRVFLVSLEILVPLGKMEGQVYQDLQAPKVILVFQELQGLQEPKDQRVAWGGWDYQEFLE